MFVLVWPTFSNWRLFWIKLIIVLTLLIVYYLKRRRSFSSSPSNHFFISSCIYTICLSNKK
jgi:hypothetical protein